MSRIESGGIVGAEDSISVDTLDERLILEVKNLFPTIIFRFCREHPDLTTGGGLKHGEMTSWRHGLVMLEGGELPVSRRVVFGVFVLKTPPAIAFGLVHGARNGSEPYRKLPAKILILRTGIGILGGSAR